MDLRTAHPYWLIRNGLLSTYPPLETDLECEVLVIGAGITGALIADAFVAAGVDTVVIDKREVGWGSTSASTALLQYEIDTPLHELAGSFGREFAERCYQACGRAIDLIADLTAGLPDDCGFARAPSLFLARKKSDRPLLEDEFAARRAAGFEVTWLDPEDLAERFGIERSAAILSEKGGRVDAFRLAHRLLDRARSAGARIHDRTKLTDYRVEGGKVIAGTDRGPTIHARHIVFSTGYEATRHLPKDLVDLNATFAVISEPVDPALLWERGSLIWESGSAYLYLRTTDDHRILIGGEDEPSRNPVKRDARLARKTKVLLKKFAKLFPAIPFEPAFAWAGTFGETPDGLPYIGSHPDFPCASFALGFGGNGITYSILAAHLLRDGWLGRENPDKHLFRFDRGSGH
ncbi:MAG: FAD-binding oxidoreductase [Verrucomicrobiales bacterium]|nr:FAD-binding oxidoreductase [Verrucomicrobiales bacterium]